jgi:hypothetical protein
MRTYVAAFDSSATGNMRNEKMTVSRQRAAARRRTRRFGQLGLIDVVR